MTLDSPTADRIERRRAQRFAVAQAETGMVPRTAHGVADERSLDERSPVMRARRANREIVVTHAREQDRLTLRVAEQFFAVRENVVVDSRPEIRTGELGLPFDCRHDLSPPTNRRRIGVTHRANHSLSQ